VSVNYARGNTSTNFEVPMSVRSGLLGLYGTDRQIDI